ncbi:MAG: hypothetical protein AAGA77_17305 [Bacteroidota bacterium]
MRDPLRIFTKEQLKTLNRYHLQRLKKEFFIPFKFGGATSVNLNGHEVTQETLESIFAELEANFEAYIFDTQNEFLNEFLRNGNLDFLFNRIQYVSVLETINENPDLEERLASQLSLVISKICSSLDISEANTLQAINNWTNKFSAKNKALAYQKSYDEIETRISLRNSKFVTPFLNEKGTRYKTEVYHFVDEKLARLFDYLPKQFQKLDKQYASLCLVSIVIPTTMRDTNLKNFTKQDLKVFQDACKIASRHHTSDMLQENVTITEKAIKGSEFKFKGFKGIKGVLMFIVTIVLFLLQLSRINNSSDSSSSYQVTVPDEKFQEVNDILIKRILEGKNQDSKSRPKFDSIETGILNEYFNGKENSGEENSPIYFSNVSRQSNLELSKAYAGNHQDLLNPNIVNLSHQADTLIVRCMVDMMPSQKKYVEGILLNLILKEKVKPFQIAKLTLIERSLQFETSHYLKDKRDAEGKISYANKKPGKIGKVFVNAKRIPFADYHIKGYISRREVTTGKTKERQSFDIKYDRTEKHFDIAIGKNQKFKIPLELIKNPSSGVTNEPLKTKMACIIRNLGKLHNILLFERNWYTLEDISDYSIYPEMGIEKNLLGYRLTSGKVRNNYTSSLDNISYCQLHTKNTSIRYVLDQKTGVTKGMTSAVISNDKKEVEQIVCIRQ